MREQVVRYARADSLHQFLNVVGEDLNRRMLEGHPARFEIVTAKIDATAELEGKGGATILVWGEDDHLEQIYTCTYRGLFSDSVFTDSLEKQKFYTEFHMWLNRGKLHTILEYYLSHTIEAELEVALGRIEIALISLAKEGNLLLGNLDLIGRTDYKNIGLIMEEVSRFADEQSFVGYAERVRENIVKAKLCMFCALLREIVAAESGGQNG